MKIRKIMIRDVISFKPNDPLSYVAWSLHENKISGAPVVDHGNVVGIVSESDILRYLEEKDIWVNLFTPKPHEILELVNKTKKRITEVTSLIEKTAKTPVTKVMKSKVITVSQDDLVSHVSKLMRKNKINRVPVIDNMGRLKGIVTREDLLSAMI